MKLSQAQANKLALEMGLRVLRGSDIDQVFSAEDAYDTSEDVLYKAKEHAALRIERLLPKKAA